MTNYEEQILEFDIPDDFAGQVVRFSLQCSRAFVPAEKYDTSDKRELGIMVSKIFSE
jgi:hypothetical protein